MSRWNFLFAFAFICSPTFGGEDEKFRHWALPEQLETGGATSRGSLAETLRTGSEREKYQAVRRAWEIHDRVDAADVLKFLVGPPNGDAAFLKFQREVDEGTKSAAIDRELKRGDYLWGAWLAFLRPHQDLVPTLLDGLKRHPKHLHATMLALGASRDAKAIDPLLAVLKSDKYLDVGMAAQALGYLGDSRVEPELLKTLKKAGVWDRAKICDALGMIGTKAAIPILEKLGNSDEYTGEISLSWRARLAVVKIERRLKPIGDGKAMDDPISPIARLQGGSDIVESFAFSPDSKLLASASSDAVRMWNLEHEKVNWAIAGHTHLMTHVVFAFQGRQLATAGRDDGAVRMLDVSTGRPLSTIDTKVAGSRIRFSPDCRLIAAAQDHEKASIELWDTKSEKKVETIRQAQSAKAFSPDGKILAFFDHDEKTAISFWDLERKSVIGSIEGKFYCYHAAFSPSGDAFVTAEKWNLHCFDMSTKKLKFQWRSDSDIDSIAVSPDGRWLAVGEDEDQVRILDTKNGKVVRTIDGRGHVAFSPDGKQLATGSTDTSAILIWKIGELNLPQE